MKLNQLFHIGSLSIESSFTKRECFYFDANYNFLLFSTDMLCVSLEDVELIFYNWIANTI